MEIRVILSTAFRSAYFELTPQFEEASGHKLESLRVPIVQMVKRLRDGEKADVMILPAARLDELIGDGIARERVDLARSGVGVAVPAGAPKPDIRSGEAVKRALLAAKHVVYSTGPSGVYLLRLFERMGILDQVKAKATQVQGEPAGAVAARGEADLAFQQVSELLPVPGIDFVGPLPPDIQEITVYSAGLHARAAAPDAARALVRFLRSPAAAPVIRKSGMEPA